MVTPGPPHGAFLWGRDLVDDDLDARMHGRFEVVGAYLCVFRFFLRQLFPKI